MLKYFPNEFFETKQNLPLIRHSNEAKEPSILLIRTEIKNYDSIKEKISKGLIKGIIASENILKNFEELINCEKIPCKNTSKAWAYLSFCNFEKKPNNIIAITGTNGKTSTSWFVYSILLKMKKNVLLFSSIGIFENDQLIEKNCNTTSDSLIIHKYMDNFTKKYGKDSFCILETTSIAIEQNRIEYVNPTISIWTNFSQDHLDYHKTMKEYFKCKLALGTKSEKFLIHNSINQEQYLKYGQELIRAEQNEQLELKLNFANEIFDLKADVLGLFQAENILSAIIALKEFFDIKEIIKNANNLKAPPGRMEKIKNIIIDFGHTPDALEKALKTLRKIYSNKIIVIMGCGGNRDQNKRQKIGKIMNDFADIAIITNDNPRYENPKTIALEIKKGCLKATIILERSTAIKTGIEMLEKNDVLLIAGKGAETTIEINGEFLLFNDKECVLECLEKI